jgi:hypothetical protein
MINAYGNTVFIVAYDNMMENELDVHMVQGLGSTISIQAKRYIAFCKSRAGNDILNWFNKNVVKSFIEEIRNIYDWDN